MLVNAQLAVRHQYGMRLLSGGCTAMGRITGSAGGGRQFDEYFDRPTASVENRNASCG